MTGALRCFYRLVLSLQSLCFGCNLMNPRPSNTELCNKLKKLVDARNKIAHGRSVKVQLASLKSWQTMISRLSPRLENKVAEHIEEITGKRPSWG